MEGNVTRAPCRSPLAHVSRGTRGLIDGFCRDVRLLPEVRRIFLYGSYAKNTFTRNSDCDIAVFVDDTTLSLRDIHRRIARISINGKLDLQPQVFLLSELDDPIGIVEEIVSYGIEL